MNISKSDDPRFLREAIHCLFHGFAILSEIDDDIILVWADKPDAPIQNKDTVSQVLSLGERYGFDMVGGVMSHIFNGGKIDNIKNDNQKAVYRALVRVGVKP